MAVYIASELPLPLVPWNIAEPSFHVSELTSNEDDEAVKDQFSKPFIYYVGAYTGCSCGFEYGRYPKYEDDVEKKRQSVKQLSDYLVNIVQEGISIELFACWEGSQAEKPVKHRTISPAHIGGDNFWFEEKEFLLIQK